MRNAIGVDKGEVEEMSTGWLELRTKLLKALAEHPESFEAVRRAFERERDREGDDVWR